MVALRKYTQQTIADQPKDDARGRVAVQLANMFVWQCRNQIREHCVTHKCDPLAGEILKVRALRQELMHASGIHPEEPL